MDEEKRTHDIALAYLLHRTLTDSPLLVEDFCEEYERAVRDFKELMSN